MKKLWLVAALTLMALSLGTVTTNYAQSVPRLEGTIPFNFMVGDRPFKSGEYNINLQSTQGLLKVMGKDGQQAVYVLSRQGKQTSQADMKEGKVIFRKYGDLYFLSNVVNPWNAMEWGIPMSKAEKEAVKNQTVNSAANNKTVLIAMKAH